MTDSVDLLSLALGQEPVDDAQPDAAETAATPTNAEEAPEEITLDEALAGLDGEAAPDETAAAATEPESEPTPDEVAELRRQVDEFKAKEAEVKARQADAQFLEPWRN